MNRVFESTNREILKYLIFTLPLNNLPREAVAFGLKR